METLTVTSLSRQIAALRAEVESLRREVTTDELTGLGNRRFLESRTTGRGGFFVAIDLNSFKRAQDAHALKHAYGDRVLRSFANLLLSCANGEDRVACRVGGDEFVIWCPNREAATRMKEFILMWRYGIVTASAGIGETLVEADIECMVLKGVSR